MCRYGWCFASEDKAQTAQTAQIHTGMECMERDRERSGLKRLDASEWIGRDEQGRRRQNARIMQ